MIKKVIKHKMEIFCKYIIILTILFGGNLLSQTNSYELDIENGNNYFTKDFSESEKSYRNAISKNSDSIKGIYNLANAYYKNDYYDEALLRMLEASKKAVNSKEKHIIFHNIGNILMKKELCNEAVESYKNALRNNPDDNESRYNLALAKKCAENENKDQQKKNDEEKNDQSDENKDDSKEDQNDKSQDNNDKNDSKEDQNDKSQDNNDDKDDSKEDQNDREKKEKNSPQPKSGKLSKEQIKNLLEAMNNEENKVQEKINAKKLKGVKLNIEKDW